MSVIVLMAEQNAENDRDNGDSIFKAGAVVRCLGVVVYQRKCEDHKKAGHLNQLALFICPPNTEFVSINGSAHGFSTCHATQQSRPSNDPPTISAIECMPVYRRPPATLT